MVGPVLFFVFASRSAGWFQSYQVAKAGLELFPYLPTTTSQVLGYQVFASVTGFQLIQNHERMRETMCFTGTGFTWKTKWLCLTLFWILGEFSSPLLTSSFPSLSIHLRQGFLPLLAVLDPALEVFLALFLLVALGSSPGGLQVPVYTAQMEKPASCQCICNTHCIPGAEISPVYKTVSRNYG